MNASNSQSLALPKPEPRTRTKGRAKRTEAAVAKKAREKCVERDKYCRVTFMLHLAKAIYGPSEHAHMHIARRSKTRGQAAAVRHDSKTSLMLCKFHHMAYDAKELTIEALTDQGADGRLKFSYKGRSYSE